MPAPTAAPARIFGAIDPLRYSGTVVSGVVDGTQRTTNGTLMQSAFTYAAGANKYLEIDPVRVEYSCSTTDGGVNVGLFLPNTRAGIIGAGATDRTFLCQYAAGHPTLTLGDDAADFSYDAQFRHFAVGRGITGTAGSRGILVGSHFKSKFEHIVIARHDGAALSGGSNTIFHPEIGLGHRASSPCFSTTWDTISPGAGQVNLWNCATGSGTQNKFLNIYCGSGNGESDRNILTSEAIVYKDNIGGLIENMNMEWCESYGIKIENSPGLTINGFHMEGLRPIDGTFNPQYIRIYGLTGTRINGVSMYECSVLDAHHTGDFCLVSVGADAAVEIDGLLVKFKSGAVYGGKDELLALVKMDSTTNGENNRATIKRLQLSTNTPGTGGITMDDSLPVSPYGQLEGCDEYTFENGRSRTTRPVINVSDADFTLWAAHRNAVVRIGTLTAARKLVLKDFVGHTSSGAAQPREVGDTVEVRRGSGAFDYTIRNAADNATLFTLTASQTGKYFWTGSTWTTF